MDIEELLKKKQEKEIQLSKPVFLTKEEREKLALERRAAEVEEKKKKLEEQQKLREQFLSQNNNYNYNNIGKLERESREKKEKKEREREKRQREKELEKENPKKIKEEEKEREKEIEMIKNKYLGLKKEKKKIIKPSEKFKFVFDWDISEDTSKENPLNKHEIRPMLGRGFIAGIDKTEQIEEYTKFLEEQQKLPKGDNIKKILEKKISSLKELDSNSVDVSKKPLEEMTERDWRIFREDHNISTRGGNIPKPIRNWKEGNLRKRIMRAIEKIGYKEPTPIQMQAIPIGLQGRDIMGIAETGSGKTAAFVIPMLEYILKLPKLTPETEQDGPYAIVLAPTRELVLQIEQETKKFSAFCDVRTIALVGGVSIEEQGFALRRGCEIVIATPGRLNDCIDSRYIVLNQCNYVVLDEADRMIDMGFEPQVITILEAMPSSSLKSENEEEAAQQESSGIGKYRTTIMFSATMPVGVERLARKYLRRPAYVVIGEIGKAVDRIEQRVEWVNEPSKFKRLQEILAEGPPPPIMVFCNKKKSCDAIAKYLEKLGWKATTLHSGKSQQQREASIEGFKANKYEILIATDVAGRGIDVRGVTHVINFDMPKSIEDYTHRIGRTGRAGMEGLATSFLTTEDTDVLYDLKQMLIKTHNIVPQELDKHPAAQCKPGTIPDRKPRRETIIYAKT